VRTQASLQALTQVAAKEGVIFAGSVNGGYVFPEFLPGYDAVASLANLLELLTPVQRPLSELVAELPRPTLVHRQIPCPWAMKGLVMRVLNERFSGRDVDLTDGIKVFEDRGWAQALPDPDEPLIHLYAEGETASDSEELAAELRAIVEEIGQGEAAPART
jgi:mannose-1-phosphate guanylyltransferase / phosphomannomutase